MGLVSFLNDNFVPRIPEHIGAETPHAQGGSEQDQNDQIDPKAEKDAALVYSRLTLLTRDHNSHLERRLRGRHVQLLGIGATIGSALFVSIGQGLAMGPLNLLLGFVVWSIPILFITVSTAEMVTYLPIPLPFVRLAGRCCDSALEVATAWNFWFLCCAQIPFEVVTVNSIIHFWRDDYLAAIPLVVQVVLYFIINTLGVSLYGEVEFWLSLGKVVLATGLILFTFVTMVGGNPKHDAFGFRYWRDPGPMNVYFTTGALGRFEGFMQCLIRATFTFAGPEYVLLVASETINPRKTLPSAYKQVFIRLTVFFIGGALCVGILVAYNDPRLQATLGVTEKNAAGLPYVIAMQNLNIRVLPDIVNVLLVTAAFSAGNSYTFCSLRTLYGFAVEGYFPKIFTATTKSGIPLYCVMVSLLWAFVSFLQLGKSTKSVLDWIINLITSCQLVNFCVLTFTYIFFHRALKAQGIDRNSLPFRGWWQPWLAIAGFVLAFVMLFVGTYPVFLPGQWNIKTFLFSYLFIFIDIGVFVVFKLWRRTRWKRPEEVDLTTGLKEVEEHERVFYAQLEAKRENGLDKRLFVDRVSTFLFGSAMR